LILTIGGLAYAILCVPAIERRGYPPIDHVWMAMTYLWIAPLALSTLFDGGASPSRRWHLIAYAVLTGFVDAATEGVIVPRYVTFLGTLLMTVFLYGPAHIVVTFAIEWCLQRLLGLWRSFSPLETTNRWTPRLSLIECLIGYSIVGMTIGFPFAYRGWVVADHQGRGRQLADDDWSKQRARHFSPFFDDSEPSMANGVRVTYDVDRTTGFCLIKHGRSNDDMRNAYNDRIAELVREHGIPSWTMKPHLISPEALAELLNSSDCTEITSLPFEVTPSIVVFKTGTISKWGSTMTFNGTGSQITSSGSSPGGLYFDGSGLAIATQADGLRAVGSGSHPIFLIRHDDDTICIRYGANWIGLFHRDGRLLEYAAR
jgi:hypothetical protein